ncbi:MAG: hypothetical protein K6V73_01540 [Firmicutes bacterium]|nr:hypothetical protein [Bacillota bacterium]
MSFFAHFTHEGSRSIVGQYLALLGLGAFGIAAVGGPGELAGYGLRQVSCRLLARRRGAGRAETLVQATRNPPRDATLSHAARDGLRLGIRAREALDQFRATFGPLLIALLLAVCHGRHRLAFASLAVPAAIVRPLWSAPASPTFP